MPLYRPLFCRRPRAAVLCCLVASACLVAMGVDAMADDNEPFRIVFPQDGDVLTRHDGEETDAGLAIRVRGVAPPGAAVSVNGAVAECIDGAFECPLLLTQARTALVAETQDAKTEARVYWDKGSRKRYRFSVDDNIEFLKDLGLAPEQYPSLFDHWYLAFWREMHLTYGVKVHFNIYYQTDGFDLSQMPDRWKEEWRENASWIRLSFHALQDKPDRPYRNAGYVQLAHDYDLVCGHIRRFAGNELLRNTTTIHWAECTKPAAFALRDRGIENVIGLFGGRENYRTTAYYLTPDQSAHCDERPAWHDHDTGLTFIPCAVVVNSFSPEGVIERLEQRAVSPHTAERIELLIHEQYFRKELPLYQPDILDKVKAALDWVAERNYEPVFWGED